ncbi:MAG: hypothetical protein ACLFUE_10820, partial [Desulfobacteraceae bacterium]
NVIKKLNGIFVSINTDHDRPFPKPDCFLLSHYQYQRRYISIDQYGRIAGGLSRMLSSLIDFSFIRSIVAHKYRLAGVAYDPVSLFMLELFCRLEKFSDMKSFTNVLRDPVRGRHYRLYAGISEEHIPCEATFSNFKARLGEELYNQIFHVLVRIVELLGFLTYKIIATDGTLFPSNSRYKGCTYFCRECGSIAFRGIIDNVRGRIKYRLDEPQRIVPGKEIRIKVECPSPRFPEDQERPKVEVLALTLTEADPENPSPFNRIFGLEEELKRAGLDITVKRGILTKIVIGESDDTFYFRCPRLPSDLDARVGVRRHPQNPNRKQKVFGFNAVIDTSIEVGLGIELPVACSTIAGNAIEGRHFIANKEQIFSHHGATAKIHLADAKYDELDNYAFSRAQRAIPIIDYNPRNENLSAPALRERGYDRNGWPYAPCGVLCRPNGFDFSSKRASFTCRRQCVESKDQGLTAFSTNCPHWINYNGFTKHMSIKEHPRLITEVIRGTDRHQKIKNLRSASERTNASAKEDFCILNKPKVRGLPRASVLSQLAVIVVLLKRALSFIVNVTITLRKHHSRGSGYARPRLPGPLAPPFLRNLIQRE